MSDSPTKSFAATLVLFRDIACLRRGPEELPVSWRLLLLTIAAQVVLGMIIGGILPPLPAKPGVEDHELALQAIDLIVPLLWGWALLQLVGRSARFLQMMTAVFGCQLVLQPLIVPALWAMLYFEKESSWVLPFQFLYVGLSLWLTIVVARIVRAATDWSMFSCVALVIAQGVATYLVALAMFPDLVELLKQGQ